MGADAGAHGPRPFAGPGSTRVIRPSELLDQRQAVGYCKTFPYHLVAFALSLYAGIASNPDRA